MFLSVFKCFLSQNEERFKAHQVSPVPHSKHNILDIGFSTSTGERIIYKLMWSHKEQPDPFKIHRENFHREN